MIIVFICMFGILRQAKRFLHTVTFFSGLIDQCFSLSNSSNSLRLIHAQLTKLGFTSNTFLGNRCIDLYLKSGSANDALKLFHDIPSKNIVSWNLYLKVFVKNFDILTARQVFDEMPERDAVSWNTIISGYISSGFLDFAWEIFLDMQNHCVRPTEFTFSMVLCCVNDCNYAKEMHGFILRNGGCYSNLVVGNALIDVYGKLGLVHYAIAVFYSMEKVDVISLNSMISGCCKSGYEQYALHTFGLMGSSGFKGDEYTVSALLTACSNLRNLEKGKQIFCLCTKLGFLRNTVVSSAAIDLFSKCNRMESAILVFEESYVFDSAICNLMIACYASHNLEDNAMQLFVSSLRDNIRPTEFTLSSVLYSAAVFVPVEQGSQLHSLVVKTGFELDAIVSSSLVRMYSKYALIDFASKIFASMVNKDLIAWNTMIHASTHHGKPVEAICLFKELLRSNLRPDQITFAGVLSACSYGGFLDEGIAIFSSMQEHGVHPMNDHYAPVVDMLIRAGRLDEAIDLLHTMPYKPHACIWEFILSACGDCGDVNLIETVAERLMEVEPNSSLAHSFLAKIYEQRGRWESLVRVMKKMRRVMKTNEVIDCSWIGIKGRTFSFQANQMSRYGGENVYSVLGLLMQEICDEDQNFP